MLKALIWKEWREQRPLALTGLCLAALLPLLILAGGAVFAREMELSALFEVYLVLSSSLLWPLFAAAAGASTVAGEIGDGTLGFLLSRPVSRTRLWTIKTMMAGGTLLLIVAASLGIAFGLSRLAASPASLGPLLDPLFSLRGDFFFTLAFGLLVLPLACSIFFSTLISRPLTAAAAGVAASLIVLFGSLWVWWRLDPSPWAASLGPALQIGFTAALTVLASSLVFSRGELLQGVPLRRVGISAAMVVGASFCLSLPLAYAKVRLVPARAVLGDIETSPAGDRVVTTAFFDYPRSPRIWMVRTDGSGGAILTGNLADVPHFSPRGNRLVYYSQRNLLGFRPGRMDLRVMGADGSSDHVLVPDLGSFGIASYPLAAFAPEGDRVALSDGETLLIAHLGPRMLESYTLKSAEFHGGTLLGWSQDGRELFFRNPTRGRNEGVVLGAFRLEDRSSRVFYRQPAPSVVPWYLERGDALTRIRVLANEKKSPEGFLERDFILVDPVSGASELLTSRGSFFSLSLSRDGDFAAYAERARTREGEEVSRIYLRNLSEPKPRLVTEVAGKVLHLDFSHSGKELLVRRFPVGDSRDAIVDLEGNATELEPGWRALGWASAGRVLMGRLNAENHVTALGVFESRAERMHLLPTGLRLE